MFFFGIDCSWLPTDGFLGLRSSCGRPIVEDVFAASSNQGIHPRNVGTAMTQSHSGSTDSSPPASVLSCCLANSQDLITVFFPFTQHHSWYRPSYRHDPVKNSDLMFRTYTIVVWNHCSRSRYVPLPSAEQIPRLIRSLFSAHINTGLRCKDCRI